MWHLALTLMLVTPDRNRLNDKTMETLELLKYWWNSGLIEQYRRR
jgi:hypothetical protein